MAFAIFDIWIIVLVLNYGYSFVYGCWNARVGALSFRSIPDCIEKYIPTARMVSGIMQNYLK